MFKRGFLLIILLIFALPSALYAVSMGNMGSVGRMVNKISIRTKTVGIVNFSHNVHGTNCNRCHPRLFKKKNNSNHVGMKAMERGKSCGACHDGKRAFSVADTSDCAKCHAGDIIFKDKAIGNITFPHSVHIEVLEGCDSCHPDLYKPKRGANKANMAAMEQGNSCGACHDGTDAFSVADTSDCAKCHAGDIIFKDKAIGNITFPHSVHIEMLEGCDSCHPDLYKPKRGANKANMAAMEQGNSCGACHDGSDAFSVAASGDCDKCHAGDIIFKDLGISDATFPHSVHIEMHDGCDSCHPDLFKPKRGANRATMEDMENGESCGACHDGSGAFGVTGDCESCHMGGIIMGKVNIQTQTVGQVVFDHEIHSFSCNSCHSKIFKMKNNSNHVSMKVMEQGKSCGACHNGKKAFNVTGDCAKCHAGEIIFKDLGVSDGTFPHSVHIEMHDGCDSCHPDLFKPKRGANKATMEDMENGESCGACHDGSGAFGVTGDCESCHVGGITMGKVNIQTQTVGQVVFDHEIHSFSCSSCHTKLFKMKNNSNHVSMKVMEQGKSCGACHNGKKAFNVTGDCDKCHAGDIVFKDLDIGEITFPHSVHIEMLDGCDSCHPDLFKPKRGTNKANMKTMENGESCGACHDGSDAFGVADTSDCSKCHAGDIIFKDLGVSDVTFPHSAHIEILEGCDSCHPDLFKPKRGANKSSMADMENGESCGACHDGSDAFSATGDCESCHEGAITMGKVNIQTQTVGQVVFDHEIHSFSCNSCHPKFFKMKNNSNHVSMKVMEQGKSCGACHNGKKAFNVTGDCARCHAGDIIFKDKNIGDTTFPHSLHTDKLGHCDGCHPKLFKPKRGENKINMKTMEAGDFCGSCHFVAVSNDCTKCHAGDILFKEEEAGNVTFPHSLHIETLDGCDSCHPDLFKPKRGANKATMEDMENGQSCGACHDGSDVFGVAEDCESCHQM